MWAVIDGATDKSGMSYHWNARDISSGRFAAEVIAAGLCDLPPDVTATAAITQLSAALDTALQAQRPGVESWQRPSASVVIFNAHHQQVWSVGDCQFATQVPGQPPRLTQVRKSIDEVTSSARVAYLNALDAAGTPWDPTGGTPDPGREFILPLLERQGALANYPSTYGYPVLNGTAVPESMINVTCVDDSVERVVLASDGYPSLAPHGQLSLTAAEDHLRECLDADPACVGALAGTKALMAGAESFDDRAWCDITRDAYQPRRVR